MAVLNYLVILEEILDHVHLRFHQIQYILVLIQILQIV